jgi:5-methylcytosine-specific restriction endonuclease McrA
MGCLALNASFEPLTILPVERALRLVLERKAEVLEADDARIFRSERSRIACPLVIRLKRYVHVPRRFRRPGHQHLLFARDGYRCQYCLRHRGTLRGREFLTRDHVHPLSRGGDNVWENVATACSLCNNRKGNHLPEECGMVLHTSPREPNYVELVWAVRRVTTCRRSTSPCSTARRCWRRCAATTARPRPRDAEHHQTGNDTSRCCPERAGRHHGGPPSSRPALSAECAPRYLETDHTDSPEHTLVMRPKLHAALAAAILAGPLAAQQPATVPMGRA